MSVLVPVPETAEAEKKINEKIIDFDNRFFDDFNFKSGVLKDLTYRIELPYPLEEFSFKKNCYCVIERMEGDVAGSYNDYRITLPPDAKDDLILHEMIHAHIDMLVKQPPLSFFSEYLMFYLYKSLKKKIKQLDMMIRIQGEYWHVRKQPYCHGLLFFLKSLDLDIRLNLPLGTVYGDDVGWDVEDLD